MDFDLLDLRQTAEKEYWVHLRLGDTLLYADMDKQEGPCRVKVASISNPDIEAQLKAVNRVATRFSHAEAEFAGAKDRQARLATEKRLDSIDAEAEKIFSNFLCEIILDWENIQKGGNTLPFSADALKDMSAKGGPLFRMASTIAGDAIKAQSPFIVAESGL